MWYRAGARKQQQQEFREESGPAITTASAPAPAPAIATALADQEQRKTLKFGFSSKSSSSKVCNYRVTLYACLTGIEISYKLHICLLRIHKYACKNIYRLGC